MENGQLKGFPISFNVYAHSSEEAEEARRAIVAFIDAHAREKRAVTARKIALAVSGWDKNPIVKNRIINYLK